MLHLAVHAAKLRFPRKERIFETQKRRDLRSNLGILRFCRAVHATLDVLSHTTRFTVPHDPQFWLRKETNLNLINERSLISFSFKAASFCLTKSVSLDKVVKQSSNSPSHLHFS